MRKEENKMDAHSCHTWISGAVLRARLAVLPISCFAQAVAADRPRGGGAVGWAAEAVLARLAPAVLVAVLVHHPELAHHVVVLVLEDVAMVRIPPRERFKPRNHLDRLVSVDAHRVLPPTLTVTG
jgi:hypothetical protein